MPDRALERERIYPVLAVEELAWVDRRSLPGGPFAVVGHAVEVALQRLHDEERHVKQECERRSLPYEPAAFWAAFAAPIAASRPETPGPRTHRPRTERKQVGASVDATLLKWVATLPGNHGFASVSHVAECALRHLHSLDGGWPVAGVGFPFDGATRWEQYQVAVQQARSPH